MDSQQVFTFGQQSLYILLMVSAPILLTVLGVGLVVSIFQAATQIHESTLSFVPKIVAAVAVLAIAGPWMLTTLVEFVQRTLQSIPASSAEPEAAARARADADLHRGPGPRLGHADPLAVPARPGAVRLAAGHRPAQRAAAPAHRPGRS